MAITAAGHIEVRAVSDEEELRLANELMAGAGSGDPQKALRWFQSSGRRYPGFRREHTRIALLDDSIAGAMRLTTDTMRVGEARLKVGGLGWVSTAQHYRHRGVCTALLQHTLDYMRGRAYHVSMLFGIPNFYHRFGYATTLADYSVTLDPVEAVAVLSGVHKVRGVKPGDIGALQRIHHANDSRVSCSLVRGSAHVKNKWDRFRDAEVLTTQQGKPVGYLLVEEQDDALAVHEIGLEDFSVAPDLLARCAQRAQDRIKPHIRFMVPPEHPFAHYLTQFESTHEMRLSRQRGGMMTLVDVGETLENMIPEWEGLLAESAVSDRRCEATLVVDGKYYRIRANRGAIDIAEFHGKNKFGVSRVDLIHLLTGYGHIADILGAERRLIAPDARILLETIFPKRNPYVHLFDRF